jgi:hypothetical protein
VRRTKEETVDVDVFLSGCELDCLFVAGWCVSETSSGVAWCELYHGDHKSSGLFGFS